MLLLLSRRICLILHQVSVGRFLVIIIAELFVLILSNLLEELLADMGALSLLLEGPEGFAWSRSLGERRLLHPKVGKAVRPLPHLSLTKASLPQGLLWVSFKLLRWNLLLVQ